MIWQPVRPTSRITPEQAEDLFASPEEFGAAFNRRSGQEIAVLRHGVRLFTTVNADEGRIYWLQGSGPTPGWDVEQVLEELRPASS